MASGSKSRYFLFLAATEWWLDGIKLYSQIQEMNPPMMFYLTVPVVAVAKGMGVDSFVIMKIYVFLLSGLSLLLGHFLLKRNDELLDELDAIVLKFSGRVYLTKDARMSEKAFKASYPKLGEFLKIRKKYDLHNKFGSCQSERLGI